MYWNIERTKAIGSLKSGLLRKNGHTAYNKKQNQRVSMFHQGQVYPLNIKEIGSKLKFLSETSFLDLRQALKAMCGLNIPVCQAYRLYLGAGTPRGIQPDYNPVTINSVLLFCAFPSGVLLSATGLLEA